ncbi:podocalyxin-like protein 2 isoform X1 [Salmo salar]|uniref:Podocalyxin-like protein 2 isoform X1 n=2 Tax=Salmo salar TaxID=8030 RepID=A0A1S3P7Z8_SALSA|nr:podocalyxin-like protein 2 isoform X1 [Salmo salar]|eukprot:XP_014023725.1 PREDICTED: podocalyxin-like protein 2 isoform X3 [Salmo salar]
MAGLHRTLIFSSTLLFLLSCDTLLSDGPPTLLSTSQPSPLSLIDLDLDVEEQPEMMTVPGSPTTVPGLTSQGRETSQQDTSQESSGFFSEDGEDNKPLQSSVNLWDNDRDQVNITDLDRKSLRGYSQTLSQSSTSPMEEPRQGNHTSPFMTAMENLERELWEMERESSGLPVELGYAQNLGLSSTTTIPVADPVFPVESTTLDPQYVPVHGGQESPPGDTVEVEEEEMDGEMKRESPTTEPDVSIATSRPTLPEVGVFPSFGPLQPDNTHTEDREEVLEEEDEEEEETVVLGGPGSDRGRGGAISPLTTAPSASLAPTVGFTEEGQEEEEERRQEEQEVKHGGTELLTETELSQEIQQVQVICVDWSDLAGKGYIILNMSDSVDCDEFREESGDRLLELLETAFSRKMDSPQGSWLISLSKPTMQDHQLLITLASEHGVIATKDVLSMLGEIRKGLHKIGIQSYSSASTCHSRPSQTRSDYGKLFVVLVIIGSVCLVIIASGLIYICWQRRLPKLKTRTRGEELHFVENGCHDNPTLDVTSDGGQPEMQEKKHHHYHHANGLTAGTGSGGMAGGEGGSSGWQVLVNKPGGKEEDNMEEDTHL